MLKSSFFPLQNQFICRILVFRGVGFARYVAALGPARAEMADAMGQLLGQKHAALKKNKDSLKRETALEMIAREELAQALTALRQNEDELTLARVKFDSLCDYTKQRVMEATAKAEEKVWRLGEKVSFRGSWRSATDFIRYQRGRFYCFSVILAIPSSGKGLPDVHIVPHGCIVHSREMFNIVQESSGCTNFVNMLNS